MALPFLNTLHEAVKALLEGYGAKLAKPREEPLNTELLF
jgi:hypothetical protein